MTFIPFEDAARCPKCGNTGEDTKQFKKEKSTVHVLMCMNSICLWYQTTWIVQQMEDNTVPVREFEPRRPKTFPKLPGTAEKYLQNLGNDE